MRHWQTNPYFLRSLKVIAWGALTFSLLFYLLPLLLFRIPAVQREVAERTAHVLSDLFDTPVEIQRVALVGWTNIEAHQVLVRDTADRPMLRAKRLVGGLDLLDLVLDQEVRVTSARLFKAELLLIQDPQSGRLNLQHTIDHLSKPSSSSKSIPVDINSIIIRDMRVSLERAGHATQSLSKLSTRIRRLRFAPGYIGGAIDELSCSSSFGLQLSSLTAQLELKESLLTLTNLQLALPHSQLSLPLARLQLQRKGLGILQELELGASELQPTDLTFLHPALKTISAPLHLQASYCVEDSLQARLQLLLRQSNQLYLEGETQVAWDERGQLTQLRSPSIELATSSAFLKQLPAFLPSGTSLPLEELLRAGQLTYRGRLDFRPAHHLASSGTLTSAQGRWSYDLQAGFTGARLSSLKGSLSSADFDPSPWLPKQFPLGRLASQLSVDLKNATGDLADWQGTTSLRLPWVTYGGTRLRELSLQLTSLGAARHLLSVKSSDPNLRLQAQAGATVQGKTLTQLFLEAQLQELDGTRLPLLPQLGKRQLSFSTRLRLSSLDLDQAEGSWQVNQLSLTSPEQTLQLERILLTLSGKSPSQRILSLRSPYLTAQLLGKYRWRDLLPDLQKTLYQHFPALAPTPPTAVSAEANSSWELALQLQRLPKPWMEQLRIPLGLEQGASLEVSYTGATHDVKLSAVAPLLRLQGNQLHDFRATLFDGQLDLWGELKLASGRRISDIGLHAVTAPDSISTQISLGRDSLNRPNGYLNLGAHLLRQADPGSKAPELGVSLTLAPSEVRILDDRWQIAPATLIYRGKELHVHGVDLASAARRVRIDGALSPRPDDHLEVGLTNIHLGYILSAAGVGFNLVDTELTGQIQARLVGGKVLAWADVSSPSFLVKGVDAGALQANLHFDSGDGRIMLTAQVDQATGGHADVAGYIRPAGGAGIDLHFDATQLQSSFVAPFMNTLFDEVRGLATGQMRLFGVFEQGVTVEGTADVSEGVLGVRLLGTHYHFSKRLTFTPTSIRFDQIPVTDDEGHTGVLDGVIRHRFFDEFDLDLTASQLNKMKVLETSTKQTLPFFGRAYGSGTAKLRGKLPKLLFDVDLRSDAGTDITLDFNTTDVRKEERLFSFKALHQDDQDSLAKVAPPATTPSEETELTMHLALRVTPEARLALRLGSQTIPNEVKARCEGNLTIDVPYFGAPTTYGSLLLRDGTYIFNFEELTRKRFELTEGGRLDFRGDPLTALVSLKATHALTANIADLDAGLSTLAQRTTMPIHCIIQLGGSIAKPDIQLGVELSGAEPELERRVQSLLSTEDERNRQFLYLMTLGKFYTPENRGNTIQVSNNLTSLATSTLAAQLNRLLGGLSQTVQLGTNLRTNNTAFEDTDIELLFSSRWLGDRLLINGNVGYHDNPFLSGRYIGEFDLEYKLNPSGTLRLKGYSHYNNMYQYLRQSLTTQGVGFMFQRRFDSLQELFTPKRKGKKSTFAPSN